MCLRSPAGRPLPELGAAARPAAGTAQRLATLPEEGAQPVAAAVVALARQLAVQVARAVAAVVLAPLLGKVASVAAEGRGEAAERAAPRRVWWGTSSCWT